MTVDFSTRPRRGLPGALDAALLLIGIVTLGLAGLSAYRASLRLADTRSAVADMQRRARAGEKQARALLRSGNRREEESAGRVWLTTQAPPGQVLAALESLLPAGARLDGIVLKYGAELAVQMKVVVRHPEVYDVFLERLEASGRFRNLQLGAEGREDQMAVTVEAEFVPGEAR